MILTLILATLVTLTLFRIRWEEYLYVAAFFAMLAAAKFAGKIRARLSR